MKKYTINMLKKDIKALKNDSLNTFLRTEILAITDYRDYIAIEEVENGTPIFSIEINDHTEKEEFKVWTGDEIETQRTIEEALNYAISSYLQRKLENFNVYEEVDALFSHQLENMSDEELEEALDDTVNYIDHVFTVENGYCFKYSDLYEQTQEELLEAIADEINEILDRRADQE